MYRELCNTPSDINEHLPTLRDLASECKHVTEMGVRYVVSTFAFVEGLKDGSTLVSIDYKHPHFYNGSGNLAKVAEECLNKGIKFRFLEQDTLKIEIEPTDLLFIDTNHTYEQLSAELKRHASKAKKYIVLHDTVSCPEMLPAIDEWLKKGVWKLHAHYPNNNGVSVYARV
jgi:predicted O-methyltransferase YrrM